jgi:L-asparaginase II
LAGFLVEVTRGDLVESIHQVAACAVDVRGMLHLSAGDIDVPVFLRSSAKPFIAAAAVEAGVVERFGLEQCEIAVMSASHHAEAFHIEAVQSILRKIGMEPSALQCGAHYPYKEASAQAMMRSGDPPSPLHNNCSGKHAGILALCVATGADPSTYLEVSNPAEQVILEFCARMSNDDAATWPLGVDGCGIPVYATSLRRAALAFARFATLDGIAPGDAAALRIVRDAMIAYPQYVSGTGELDTVLMQVGEGGIACKGGAEGIHAVAAIAAGLGYVSKVLDGAGRARGPSTIAALRRLSVLDDGQATKLAGFARPAVYNQAGRVVGEIRVPDFELEKASRDFV